MAYKNKYIPTNKSKYIGDFDSILCRSLWERKFCKYLDNSPNVIRWGFELLQIPYYSPVDNKYHNYIPDFIVEYTDKQNKKQISIIEIKPYRQTEKKNKKISLKESIVYSVNLAKWESAKQYCKEHGWIFKLLTEKELFK